MIGILGTGIDGQLAFVHECVGQELAAVIPQKHIHRQAIFENGEDGGYGEIESQLLYAFIRRKKPAKIVQIGCGVSTAVILRAAIDEGYCPEIVCIEPFPTEYLERLAAEQSIRLIKEKAQKVDIQVLSDISANDLLFVDSTHTVKPGSEVNRLILEVFPRLKKGTWIHLHDIYFPYDFKRDLLDADLFFWSESTLLQAFLTQNNSCRIDCSMSMLHYAAPDKLKLLLTDYVPQGNENGLKTESGKHFPSAIYLQTI